MNSTPNQTPHAMALSCAGPFGEWGVCLLRICCCPGIGGVVLELVVHRPWRANMFHSLVPAAIILVEYRRFGGIVIHEVAILILNQTVRQRVYIFFPLARVADSIDWAFPLKVYLQKIHESQWEYPPTRRACVRMD
jgi:hypothetical protein